MKLKLTLLLLFITACAWSQTRPVKIVFDLASKEEGAHQSAVRHVKTMSSAYPDSQFELVIYGEALSAVLRDRSSVASDIEQLTTNKNVSIKVCEETLKRKGMNKSQLLKGIDTVPDGILEIIARQNEGWGYIKESP